MGVPTCVLTMRTRLEAHVRAHPPALGCVRFIKKHVCLCCSADLWHSAWLDNMPALLSTAAWVTRPRVCGWGDKASHQAAMLQLSGKVEPIPLGDGL